MPVLDSRKCAGLLADPGARTILELLCRDGGQARIVGGAVRNALLGRPITDIDIATTLLPAEVIARAAISGLKAVPTGVEHGTVTLVVDKRGYEVTTLRRDVETDGRRAVVAFSRSFAEDAQRRDFTINQMSLDAEGAIHDYAGGLADLAARRVRFIGEAEQRIREDYLRILRFFRFSAEYGEGALDPAGLEACARLKDGMRQLSRERIWAELKRLMVAPRVIAVMASLTDRSIWRAISDRPADLAMLAAAVAIWPACDAVTRLVALAVRMTSDVEALETGFRLSGAERKRLADAAAARTFYMAADAIDGRTIRRAAFRIGPQGASDGLATLATGLNGPQARAWLEQPAPASPFRGADIVAHGVSAGPKVGEALACAVSLWERADFPQDEAQLRALLTQALRETLGEAAVRSPPGAD